MPGVVVFLQNAWSPVYAGSRWPRDSWLRALRRSQTGKRLGHLIGENLDLCENTTPVCGFSPSSIVRPDYDHMVEIITRRKPDIIVACGREAERALGRVWSGPLIATPHPAARVLTTALLQEARALLDAEFRGRLALRQRRGHVDKVEL
jgi:hypothetical protein